MNIKVGDVLEYKDGSGKRRVLAIVDEVVCLSYLGPGKGSDGVSHWSMLNEIERDYTLPEKPWEPEIGKDYWYLASEGGVWSSNWDNLPIEQKRRNFLGVFPTEEAAEARRDEIKKLLKK